MTWSSPGLRLPAAQPADRGASGSAQLGSLPTNIMREDTMEEVQEIQSYVAGASSCSDQIPDEISVDEVLTAPLG